MVMLEHVDLPARPRVTGPLPGPRSAELLIRQGRREPNARVYPRHIPIAVDEAWGSFVRDLDGNVFIDFVTGAGVLSLGHNHPELVRVATEHLGRFAHGLDLPTPATDAFTEAQLSLLPPAMRSRTRVHFCGPTGVNAVDAAIKLCKTATGRSDVVSFQGGFHGTTHLGMAVTGLVATNRPIGNGVPGAHFFPYSNCTHCPMGLTRDICDTNCIRFLEQSLRDPNAGISLPAAVLLELVQGKGGVVPADHDFVRRLRVLTHELDIPLVVDEVQTGCGRTGTWFAFEQYGIEPDVIIASNAMSEIGQAVASIMYDERLDSWAPDARTGTFWCNQPAFAAGAEAVRIIRRDDVLGNVRRRAAQIAARLAVLRDHPWVRDVRGVGLMWGIELAGPLTGSPAGDLAACVQAEALANGLIAELGGRDDCVVRMSPPLNVTAEVVDMACSIVIEAVERSCAESRVGSLVHCAAVGD
jgi:diaminobutyrate-2-oxoglutarate transaminase